MHRMARYSARCPRCRRNVARPNVRVFPHDDRMVYPCAIAQGSSRGELEPRRPGGLTMSVTETDASFSAQAALPQPRARIGLIIPAVNRVSEPQFNHFAPPGLGIH